MEFRVLGPLEVLADDGELLRLGSARERFVLGTLLLASDRPVPADRLVDGLWEEPPPTAKQQLQNLVAALRRRFAAHDPLLVVTRPLGYELRMGGHTLDLLEFRRLVAEARALEELNRPSDVARLLSGALSLWRGDALGDTGPDAGTSTQTLQQSLREERIAAVDLLVESLARLGRHDEVLTTAAAQLEDDPWNERLHEHRLRALAATGRRSEASDAYRRLRRRFIDELGVPPSQALADLNNQILEGGPLDGGSPRRRVVPRELPAPTWTLIGREAVLGAVLTRLAPRRPERDSSSRSASATATSTATRTATRTAAPPALVVLVGVGGVGKTALAVTAGHALADEYPDGTLYAALSDDPSGAVDPHDVLARFLRGLGVDGSEIPVDREERIALYRSLVAGKRILAVIDGATSESQVRPLLPTSPGAAAIVTSRSKLAGLVGVRRHTVQPLSADASLALLTELAGPERDLGAGDTLDDISSLCGHLPLALCVAGSKLATNSSLTLPELRDRLTHQHTRLDELSAGDIDVRASIALSVEDLPVPARTLFRRLAVAPVADWPAWVARRLLAGVSRDIEAHHALEELVDRHLVEPTGRDAAGQPRYRMHSLVSELAAEYLAVEESQDVAARLELGLGQAWLGLADVAGPRLEGTAEHEPEPTGDGARDAAASPSEWFESERVNLVGAVAAAARLGDPELSGRLALAIRGFLTVRAYDDDRERALRAALEAGAKGCATAGDRLRQQLLVALFAVLAQRRRTDELPEVAAESLRVARRIGDPGGEQRALSQSAWAAMALHRFEEALEGFTRTAAFAERRGDTLGRVRAEAQRGTVLRNIGRAEEADPYLATMVETSRRVDSRRDTTIWMATRAEGLIDLRRWDEARALLEEALAIATEIHDELGEAHCRLGLGRALLGAGQVDGAVRQLRSARVELDARAGQSGDLDALRLEVDVLAHHQEWQRAAEQARCLVQGRRREQDPLDLAADLAREAHAAHRLGDDAAAASLRSEATAILRALGLTPAALRLPAPPYPVPAALLADG